MSSHTFSPTKSPSTATATTYATSTYLSSSSSSSSSSARASSGTLKDCLSFKELFHQSDANIANTAPVARIMKMALPDNAKIAKEAKECMQECVSEFISFITSEGTILFFLNYCINCRAEVCSVPLIDVYLFSSFFS